MNLDPSETKLENLLRGLVPDAPSSALMDRIDEELKLDMSWLNATARPRRRGSWLSSAGWSAVGAAAAVAVMSFMQTQPSGVFQGTGGLASAESQRAALPVSTTIREWDVMKQESSAQEEAGRSHEKPVLVLARNKRTWLGSGGGSRITMEAPHEEKLALPVNFLGEAPFALADLPISP